MALVDARYRFLFVDVGTPGMNSDTGLFEQSDLFTALQNEQLNVPAPKSLPGDNREVPYHMIADDAFGLRNWLMKPFTGRQQTKEQRAYNYRLSRARRVVENVFGILAQR